MSQIITIATVVFMCALLIVGLYFLYKKTRLKMIQRIQYSREFNKVGVYEGQRVTFTEIIYNDSWFPLFFIDMESWIDQELRLQNQPFNPNKSKQLVISRFHLWPHMEIRREHSMVCMKRGYYSFETSTVYTNKQEIFFDSFAEIYVYPKCIEFEDVPWPINNIQGESISNRQLIVDPFSMAGIRDYQPGDPFKNINFKATARTGGQKLKVNKRDYCSTRVFMLFLNFQTTPDVPIETEIYEKLMEQGMSYTASLIEKALTNGHKIGFAANCSMVNGDKSVSFPISTGAYNIEDMLKMLALIRPAVSVSFGSLLNRYIEDQLQDTEIFIMTTQTNPEMDEQIATLRRMNNTVNVFMLS